MSEETYKMKFECKNCFNKFTDEIPYGKKLKVESGLATRKSTMVLTV